MVYIPVKLKNEIKFTVIDFEDLEVAGHRWYSQGKYVYRNRSKIDGENYPGISLLHRDLLKPSSAFSVDHKNGNPFDNRRCNLRLSTPAQQNCNLPTRKDNKAGRLGIHKRSDCNRWAAFIQKNKKHIYLGLFKTKEEAIQAREKAELEIFGDLRRYQ